VTEEDALTGFATLENEKISSTGVNFTDMFTKNFYQRRSQKPKTRVKSPGLFALLGSSFKKALNLVEINHRCQFHRHFMSRFL